MRECGKLATYKAGCRCDECRAAAAKYKRGLVARRRAAGTVPNHAHGTRNGYVNWSCRCETCTAAWAAYNRTRKRERRNESTPESAHGTMGGYDNWGCRCRPCRDARSVYQRERYRLFHSAAARGSTWGKVCKHGHPLEGEHLYVRKDGRKMCRTCNLERAKRWRKAKAAA